MLSFEEYLDKYESLIYSNVGTSMLPLIKEGRDLFTISPKNNNEPVKKGDVVLYKRAPDRYVLHRVIGKDSGGYILLGDNSVFAEKGITDNDVLGIMTSFVRKGRTHSVNEKGYKLYSFIWTNTAYIRIFLKSVLFGIKRRIKHRLII